MEPGQTCSAGPRREPPGYSPALDMPHPSASAPPANAAARNMMASALKASVAAASAGSLQPPMAGLCAPRLRYYMRLHSCLTLPTFARGD